MALPPSRSLSPSPSIRVHLLVTTFLPLRRSNGQSSQCLMPNLSLRMCLVRSIHPFRPTLPLSDAQGEKLFRDKLQVAVDDVRAVVGKGVHLNENQFGALVSLAYNTGRSNLQKSKLISRLNKGEDQNTVLVEETMDWIHSGGKRISGLENRRQAERALFVTKPLDAEPVAAEQKQEDSEELACVIC
ncbi:lysozyme-like domain-containing protein [Mycena sanguinolenta]|nr:lysozyme-like domain-containing protein [Mycena sanguinolenta]